MERKIEASINFLFYIFPRLTSPPVDLSEDRIRDGDFVAGVLLQRRRSLNGALFQREDSRRRRRHVLPSVAWIDSLRRRRVIFLFFLCSSPVGAQLLLATQHTHALILPSLYNPLLFLRFFDRKLALFIQLQQTPPTSNSVTKFD
jgi:hypothetical protein